MFQRYFLLIISLVFPFLFSEEPVILPQNPPLILYYTSWCPYCQKVFKCLEQMGRQIPSKEISQDPKGKEELREKGGKSQVPCLFIDGKPLYESDQIIDWLRQHESLLDRSSPQS